MVSALVGDEWFTLMKLSMPGHAHGKPWLWLDSRSPCCNDKRYNICLHTDVINLINLIKKIIFEWIVKLIIIVLAILILK